MISTLTLPGTDPASALMVIDSLRPAGASPPAGDGAGTSDAAPPCGVCGRLSGFEAEVMSSGVEPEGAMITPLPAEGAANEGSASLEDPAGCPPRPSAAGASAAGVDPGAAGVVRVGAVRGSGRAGDGAAAEG